jgi:hypothetical protein
LAKEKHEALYPGYKYRPKRNRKGGAKTAVRSGGVKRKRVEEELPTEPEIVQSPSTKSEEKEKETDIKLPLEAGIMALRGYMFADRG